jgi:hypothetical protein
MTIQQLEQRVLDLERQVAELQRAVKPLRPYSTVTATIGLVANDSDFDEIVRLGREYRDAANFCFDE